MYKLRNGGIPLPLYLKFAMMGLYNLLLQSRVPIGSSAWKPEMGSFYALKASDIGGNEFEFAKLEGRVSLVVNVASK